MRHATLDCEQRDWSTCANRCTRAVLHPRKVEAACVRSQYAAHLKSTLRLFRRSNAEQSDLVFVSRIGRIPGPKKCRSESFILLAGRSGSLYSRMFLHRMKRARAKKRQAFVNRQDSLLRPSNLPAPSETEGNRVTTYGPGPRSRTDWENVSPTQGSCKVKMSVRESWLRGPSTYRIYC
jgi:hypothetical protein